ncbi:hypothetical protein KY49_723 [Burkholderia sp. MSHR3999]|nr:hypothetical protein [Burkholderia sp. MSHR3999]KIP13397.1 hypothetical protein KY49_723 [Burkholderia sp. MSHR3999]
MPSNLDEVIDYLLFNVKLDPGFVMALSLTDLLRMHRRAVDYADRHEQ